MATVEKRTFSHPAEQAAFIDARVASGAFARTDSRVSRGALEGESAKRRRVGCAPEADQDFEWIYEAIARAGGPIAALNFVDRPRASCERLAYAGERDGRRDDFRAGLRIVGFERRVTAAFSVDDTRVTILRS